MLDIRLISQDLDGFARRLGRRGGRIDLEPLRALDQERRALITRGDELRHAKGAAEDEDGQL
jgi:seryl-tRNA synthetase